MFAKLALFAAASMAVFVTALPSPGGVGGITNSCNGGQVYCCDSYQSAKSDAAQKQVGIAGILTPVSGTVGLTCDPFSALTLLQQQSCTSQQACCSGNSFNGAIVLGCSPTNVNV